MSVACARIHATWLTWGGVELVPCAAAREAIVGAAARAVEIKERDVLGR